MNNLEIHQKIERNNQLIEQMLSPNKFTLNSTIRDLLKENEVLQLQCTHQFEDGACIYCYKVED